MTKREEREPAASENDKINYWPSLFNFAHVAFRTCQPTSPFWLSQVILPVIVSTTRPDKPPDPCRAWESKVHLTCRSTDQQRARQRACMIFLSHPHISLANG